MTPEIFAEWLRRQGYKVVQTPSSYWVEFGPRVYQAIPYHHLITPSAEELSDFFKKTGSLALRYSTHLGCSSGHISYHVVKDRSAFTIRDLSKKARHDVEKGLSFGEVEAISLEQLASDGWILRRQTLVRQGRAGAETEAQWRNLCLAARHLPGFEAWGLMSSGKLYASLLAFICQQTFCVLYQQSLTEGLVHGVNNALTYVVTSKIFERSNIQSIFYGLHSLDAPPSVDEFKFRMGYRAKPVRQRVEFHPFVAPFANPLTQAALKLARKLQPSSYTLAKAAGMLEFYLQGRRPLAQQTWHKILLAQKEEILAQYS